MIRPHAHPMTVVRASSLRGPALDYAVLDTSPLQIVFSVVADEGLYATKALFMEIKENAGKAPTFRYIEPAYEAKLLLNPLQEPDFEYSIAFKDGYFHANGPNGPVTTTQLHEAIFLATYPFTRYVQVPAILLPEEKRPC